MDLHDLHDAFAELERRADALPAEPFVPPAPHRSHTLLIGASAATVLAVAGGTAWLTSSGDHAGTQDAGSPPSAPVPSEKYGWQAYSPLDSTTPAPSSAPAARPPVASTEADLERRFTAALGDLATSFTVTDTGHSVTMTMPAAPSSAPATGTPSTPSIGGSPSSLPPVQSNGVAIVGVLTAADGRHGGYDVQMFQASPGEQAQCDDPDRSHCTLSRVDGGTLAIGDEPLEGGGVTYRGEYVRADGVAILLHVSNRANPKGMGGLLASAPPLTRAQVEQVVTSSAW
ncbi:MAG: hypothetical protein ACTHMS_07520 [Jatrophihabitans sp.]|uniref:hypothetical protein n=1 Tax=Jatrophihabitans sp. TaxID=1932789 RepID=UPI003F81DD9F